MAGPVLYSTNPRFTQIVCDQYRGGRYGLLWCSEFFDPAATGRSRMPRCPARLEPEAALLRGPERRAKERRWQPEARSVPPDVCEVGERLVEQR